VVLSKEEGSDKAMLTPQKISVDDHWQ